MKKLSAILAITFLPWLAAAESVTILGLPLGGKLNAVIKKCPEDYKKRTALCWLEKPFKGSSGGLVGIASLPDENLPRWIAYQVPQISVSASGTLESIRYSTNERLWRDRREIVAGISQRFGAPQELSHDGVYSANWKNDGAELNLGCVEGKCFLEMKSKAEVERAQVDRNREKSRPSTL